MEYLTHTLPNGLRMVHLPIQTPVSYCGYAINAGTRDEGTHERGLAHFVEHMLFKGTEHRKAWHILNRMETVGGELNAYTTKEETFLYSVFMAKDFERAFELLTDLAFHANFPEAEIEKEVEVILDEIESYKDSPSELIFDEFESLLFARHPLGRMILGDKRALRTFTGESGRSFTQRFYAPSNMLFFSMGSNAFEDIVRMGEQLLAGIDFPMAERKRKAPKLQEAKSVTKHKDTHQAHVLIGGQAYTLFEAKRVPLFLLNNLLGGPGMNSLLNVSLRERNGLVYNVESNVTHYTDCGMATIYFGCAPKNQERAMNLVHQQLDTLRNTALTSARLNQAKNQAIGQLGVANDNHENLFLGLGKSFLHYNHYDSMAQVVERIRKITSEDILDVANEVYAPTHLSTLIYE